MRTVDDVVPDYDDRLAEWWSTPPYEGIYVEALTIRIFGDPDPIRLANGVSAEFKALDENGVEQTYQPFGFSITNPGAARSTQQAIAVTLDGIDGEIYSALKSIDLIDLDNPPTVEFRVYVTPDYIDTPLVLPVPTYLLREASLTRNLVTLSCTPQNLQNKKSGYIYNLTEFPGLKVYGS